MFLYPSYKAIIYHHDEKRDLNEVQTLFLLTGSWRKMKESWTIARITLPAHSKKADLQKKKYPWKSSHFLNFFGCGGLEIDDHRKMIQEVAINYLAHYPSVLKKNLWRKMDNVCSRRETIFLLKLDLKLLFLCLFMTMQQRRNLSCVG